MTWSTGPLLGFDTETTGVGVATDRIVTAALVLREGDTTSVRTWLIDPGVEIPTEAAAIHGISTEHAREHGRPPAEALEEIARAIAAELDRGVPVVAYNASFDLSILDAELGRHDLPTISDRIGRPVSPVIDPLVLDRGLDRYRRGKRRLGNLCDEYGVVAGAAGLHSADVDVIATLDVLAAIVARHPDVTTKALPELHEFQVAAHREWATNFNEWRRRQGFEGEGASVAWPCSA
ncbi:exonuclease domain-containing protein [Paraoerskovia marina]|uniref:exonuclease domain-containing protein n=1 Tax=Paraoerskovia marina TaxID=545619 RepID=UPI0004922DE0|nr:exonuclease domain-containing protein [Paraoerskovia marina]